MSLQPFSIIFAGTSAFAVPSLRALAADPAFTITLVITQPDRPVGRKGAITPPPVKVVAQELGLPVFQPERLNKEWQKEEAKLKACDFLVVASFGQILSQEVLDLPRQMSVNVHASLLPLWRGASPLQHAILVGDKVSGVTIQKMMKELDAGPILAQESTDLDPRETWQTLHDRLAVMGAKLLAETLKQPLQVTEQDASKATLCGLLSREDGVCDPKKQTADEIDRRVRALNPWPGVTLNVNGETLKILEATTVNDSTGYPVPCLNDTLLFLQTVQPAGKKPMKAEDWARGKK
jgi:methionyl-tRNA formyltransferase